MVYLIIGIPVAMLSLLFADIIAEQIARYRLRDKIAATKHNASAAIINNFSILNKGV